MKIEIYSKVGCSWCEGAKGQFKKHNLPYQEYILGQGVTAEDIQNRINALGLSYTVTTVPQIFVDEKHVGGYQDMMRVMNWQ